MKFEINIEGEGLEDFTRVQKEVMMGSVLDLVQDEINCEMGLSGTFELTKTSYQNSKPVALEIDYDLKSK